MPEDENFDAPDADIILRALGPPIRDFRVHKLLLSLASPVFKDMFSLPQPALDDSGESTVAKAEVVEVTDPTEALEIVLRMIYPFNSPSLNGNFNTLVECLVITDKYEIKGAKSRLQVSEGGDRICCRKMIKPGSLGRDCTYIQVSLFTCDHTLFHI